MNSPSSKMIPSNNIDSPTRTNTNAKRKMPDTFYKPSVTKTHLISACNLEPQNQQRKIFHPHTASLPIDTQVLPHHNSTNPLSSQPTLNSTGSANNLYEPKFPFTNMMPPSNNVISNLNYPNHLTVGQHVKTYSLPIPFEPKNPSPLVNNAYNSNSQSSLQPPPMRNYNMPYGDIPLPSGWEAERAPNGQIYYINHITKVTTWEDPRKQYNLPINQSEISHDLRARIASTVPMPNGWEEARGANGELYYINHINRSTQWEDPRISIYMQNEQLKHNSKLNETQISHKPLFNDNNYRSNAVFSSYNTMQDSKSSLTASSSSVFSNSSSNSSLNNLPLTANSTTKYNNSFDSLNQNDQLIYSLKKSLDELIEQKNMICNKLKDLSNKEMELKSKLTSQDLDDILRQLKSSNNKMSSFSEYDKTTHEPTDMDSTLINGENNGCQVAGTAN